MIQAKNSKKILTKIRLINWHYFTDETIVVNGSVLFSGENASGKSTILDAIQLVITTNSTRFNPAANEKSKRDLRGYVRCKTGEEGNTYIRSQGAVISYVALEFFEESKKQYFVIGVKLDSADVEADIDKKWFCVEGKLDSLSFIVDGKPAMDKEFTQSGKRIQFERQVGRAKENFKVRLGRLDDSFQKMIIKSMAFKPMDHVKDFINQFILPENVIRTEVLQENIRNLRELQKLINEVRLQIEALHRIVGKADEIESIDRKIMVIDIMMAIAKLGHLRDQLDTIKQRVSSDEVVLDSYYNQEKQYVEALNQARDYCTSLQVALAQNECGRLIEKLEAELQGLRKNKDQLVEMANEYSEQIRNIKAATNAIGIPAAPIGMLASVDLDLAEKAEILTRISLELNSAKATLYSEVAKIEIEIGDADRNILELEEKINLLRKNQPVYDGNTRGLLNAINDEFGLRGIESKARVFADLLEIKLPEWRDAVEGYLNTQRFNILVDPQYYDLAAEVYRRNSGMYHSVGLVNVGKIMQEIHPSLEGSLAEAVHSENRYARAYADYLLGRVVRCDNILSLKNHDIAITKECMKYQGHVLSKIRPDIYKTPYIGREAMRIQLMNAEKDMEACRRQSVSLNEEKEAKKEKINLIEACDFNVVRERIDVSNQLNDTETRIREADRSLQEAKDNPNYLELSMKRDAAETALGQAQEQYNGIKAKITLKKRDIDEGKEKVEYYRKQIQEAEVEKDSVSSGNAKELKEAEDLYQDNLRTKTSGTIAENYAPRRKTLENQREAAKEILIGLQYKYKDGDFGTGLDVMDDYREDLEKLEKSDLLSYEERLASAQEDCETEFRENFLAKMRENIQNAETIFDKLNKSLKGIYYGNDSYKFELSANRERQSLYDMITSDINIAGKTLFSSAFEDRYHTEMEDLFSKLTDESLSDSKVISELTDYRSYLDYDIQIISKEGKMQRFSKTYGEKSGGETQTPYYVAIAASFAQMYSGRETIRVLMMDEAFNNMDEDRIESMMKFLRDQEFQVILAAPPSRMEIIGEYVDSIFLAVHKGQVSTIEEYYL